jgi:ABC-type oligopeptide transport system substrate-binding subunit
MVKRFLALLAAILALVAIAACKRGGSQEEAVRQGVIDYLSKRANLNVSSMNVVVTSVIFRQNEADAVVSITAKGSAAGPGMSMRYTLERQGDQWVVKNKAETGTNPHSAGGANPHGGAAPETGGALPPGHPTVDSTKPKP